MEVKFITNSEGRFIRKGYVIIFFISVLFFLAGFVVTTVANLIPGIDMFLYAILSMTSILVQNIAIVLFSVATFIGALRDESLSNEIRRALVIASGIGIVALVVFNRLTVYFF